MSTASPVWAIAISPCPRTCACASSKPIPRRNPAFHTPNRMRVGEQIPRQLVQVNMGSIGIGKSHGVRVYKVLLPREDGKSLRPTPGGADSKSTLLIGRQQAGNDARKRYLGG